MSEQELPVLWRALLTEAAAAPDGVLSLKDDPRGEAAVEAAERLTDLGFFRIVTARRYRLSEMGEATLAARPAARRIRNPDPGTAPEETTPGEKRKGFWARFFGGGN